MRKLFLILSLSVIGLLFDISAASYTVVTTRTGELAELLVDTIYSIDSLTVTGPVGPDDLIMIADGARKGALTVLDLYNADIESVTIPENSFNGTNLRYVLLPENLKSIESYGFLNSFYLEYINFPDSLEHIGDFAFQRAHKLYSGGKTLVIPEKVEKIPTSCFYKCDSLTSIVLPENLKTISTFAFDGTGLRHIDLPEGLDSLGNVVFGGSLLQSIVIPSTCNKMGYSICTSCWDLEEAVFSEGITRIPIDMMTNCWSLRSVTIPSTVKVIEDNAFSFTDLEEIDIPEGVERILANAFQSVPLSSLILPSTLEFIGNRALPNYLSLLICYAVTPPLAYDPMTNTDCYLSNLNADIPVYVPDGSLEAYRNDPGWSRFNNIMEMSSGDISTIPLEVETDAKVETEGNMIVISIAEGSRSVPYSVFTSDGKNTDSGIVTDKVLLSKVSGLYIVKVGNRVCKISIK